jgi:hypothetical protein
MRVMRWIPGILLLVGLTASTASADATAFAGVSTSPEARPALGFAVGAGLLVVGFEFEYAHAREDVEDGAPSVRTFMGNVLLQTPVAVGGVQVYGTVGAGVYRESFADSPQQETSVGTNLGGGVKIGLAGPLRIRLDYRVFIFQGSPVYDNPQRFYAGLNVAF